MGVIIAVFTTVFNIILKLLTFLAKLIYKFIRFLGLQFPFLYLAVMLVVELCTNRGISSNPQYVSLFWLGLVLSVIFSLAYILRRLFFPKGKRDEAYYRRKFEREREKEERARIGKERGEEPAAEAPIPPGADGRQEIAATEPKPLASTSVPLPFASASDPMPLASAPGLQEDPSSPSPVPREASVPPLPAPKKRVKYPLVYRVRQDERFLLYEYEDRTELYFERPDGLRLIRTEKKSSPEQL